MAKQSRKVVTQIFKGGRFVDHGLDLDVLPDLYAYKTLLVETAKDLWRKGHPERERLPKKFEASLVLKMKEILPGSVQVPIYREVEVSDQPDLWKAPGDELDEAVHLVGRVVEASHRDLPIPEEFSKRLLPYFENYGKSLTEDETIEQAFPNKPDRAHYSYQARTRLRKIRETPNEGAVDIVGTVTMARVISPRMAITLDDGRQIEAPFSPDDESTITTALKEHSTAKVRVQGKGVFTGGTGEIEKILHVDSVILLPMGEIPFEPQVKPIWEVFEDIMSDVPEEELEKIPQDAAEEHDHYLYGTPKRKSA